jgi:predicted signal transduction protein with EAL and GGDEF domain
MVDAAVRLAHSLDLTVLADGVATSEQLAVLQDLGCDQAQGSLFARPGTAEQVTALVRGGPLELASAARGTAMQVQADATVRAADRSGPE